VHAVFFVGFLVDAIDGEDDFADARIAHVRPKIEARMRHHSDLGRRERVSREPDHSPGVLVDQRLSMPLEFDHLDVDSAAGEVPDHFFIGVELQVEMPAL
jgi:hypothetical protein